MARKSSPKPKLKDVHRSFVVQRLACYDTPKEACDALKETYGIEVSPQACEHYNPERVSGSNLAKKWVDLFNKTRKAFLKHADVHIPGANKSVRLKRLWEASESFRRKGNYLGMGEMLQQIAKECGGAFTNQRQLTGKDGGPIKFQDVEIMTDDELDAEIERLSPNPNVHPSHTTEQ